MKMSSALTQKKKIRRKVRYIANKSTSPTRPQQRQKKKNGRQTGEGTPFKQIIFWVFARTDKRHERGSATKRIKSLLTFIVSSPENNDRTTKTLIF